MTENVPLLFKKYFNVMCMDVLQMDKKNNPAHISWLSAWKRCGVHRRVEQHHSPVYNPIPLSSPKHKPKYKQY